jgi:hypothetical protein
VVQPEPDHRSIDWHAFCRGAGGRPVGGQAPSGVRHRVRLLESSPHEVSARAARCAGALDGIERCVVYRFREHRPVHLAFTAAGIASGTELRGLNARVSLIASHLDEDWARDVAQPGMNVAILDEHDPQLLPLAATEAVRQWRQAQEAEVAAHAEVPDEAFLLVDGPVRHLHRQDLVGVVKSTATQYLAGEHEHLPWKPGWRSPAWLLQATRRSERDVVCCYLRLHDATSGNEPWDHGLVRLETATLDVLDGLASLVWANRQDPCSQDPRWPVHLRPVRVCEERLRASMPYAMRM